MQLVGDVGGAVGGGGAHDVLEHLVLALQHGAVVCGAGEEAAVRLVAGLYNLPGYVKIISLTIFNKVNGRY